MYWYYYLVYGHFPFWTFPVCLVSEAILTVEKLKLEYNMYLYPLHYYDALIEKIKDSDLLKFCDVSLTLSLP